MTSLLECLIILLKLGLNPCLLVLNYSINDVINTDTAVDDDGDDDDIIGPLPPTADDVC